MRILIAGDFCPQKRVADKFELGDFGYVLNDVKELTAEADFSIVNFECPVTTGSELPIEKCGPNLCCGESGIEAVKWCGFDCVTLANNHFRDYGEEGCKHTLDICKKYNIETVGGGFNLRDASKTLYKEIKGKMVAIINCCEHEFSIATETTAGSNPLNPIRQYYEIQEARQKSDYVIVIVHGGNEHYQYPSPRMKETYRFFVDAGADAVVNHHQHCYSGYEIYKESPIIYGLGNFCFDDDSSLNSCWNEGYITIVDFEENRVSFSVRPYIQCGHFAKVEFVKDGKERDFYNEINSINDVISNEESVRIHYQEFLDNSNISFLFEPYSNRYMMALYRRKLLPSFVTKKRKLLVLAYLQCESHIEKIFNYLKR